MTTFATLLMHKVDQFQRSYGHLLNCKNDYCRVAIIQIVMLPIKINSEYILHLLLDLKPNKAPGSDKIPARLLKELAWLMN